MKKTILVSLFLASMLIAKDSCLGPADADCPEAKVKAALEKSLKNTRIEKVKKSEIDGIYEIQAGQNIFYTDKKAQYVILGHVFDMNGRDLTQEKVNALREANLKKNLDLSKAMKIGSGKHEVIVFTDPECPFCRKAEEMIKDGNVTKYVFFYPLPMHPNARAQSIHVLCSKDQAAEFDKAMKGQLDNSKLLTCKEGEQKLAAMMEIAQKIGVEGTPLFFVDGQKVDGANPVLTDLVRR